MRKSFITLFFLICLAPVLQMLFHLPDGERVAQTLAAAPTTNFTTEPFEWSKQANAWFEDHFGERAFLIRLKEQIDYSVFHTSSHVHIGKEGQLYLRTVTDVEEPNIQEILRLHEDQIVANIQRLADALAARGVVFVMTVNVMNNRLIPQYLPASAPNILPQPRIEHFIARLGHIHNVVFLDSTAVLKDLVPTQPIFGKTDFHWTDMAAATTGQVLVDTLYRQKGMVPPPWPVMFHTETVHDYSGGMANEMPLLYNPFKEDWIRVVDNIPASQNMTVENSDIFEAVLHTENYDKNLLSPIFLFGDSFSEGMLSQGLVKRFNGFYFMRWTPLGRPVNTISAAMSAFPPDAKYFMLQTIETQKTFFECFTNDAEISQAIADFERRPLQ